jgi:hypothetical protein
LQWLDEIIAAITNFLGEKPLRSPVPLDLAALFTWIKDHAVFILGAIIMALWSGHSNPHTPDDAIICSVDAAIQLT